MGRNRRIGLLTGLLVVAAFSAAGSPSARAAGPAVPVIVRAIPGQERPLEAAVASLGGHVKLRLGIIDGFSATVPLSAVGALRSLPGALSVSADQTLHADTADSTAVGSFDPVADMGSMYSTDRITGATTYWSHGFTGQGVDVALIDSGVAPVDGLTAPGKVITGPDLSFESQAPNLQYIDSFGHGTHLAGIIGGRSNAAVPGSYVNDTSDFLGMAPDARIVSVKVADSHGAADVSQVIAAIDWVVQHKNDNGMNIRVLNLSYGTRASQGYAIDPLAFAAEQAWKAGIVVVAAAGNSGYIQGGGPPGLADPAYDPYVIAAGASDPMGTLKLTDDKVAPFSASSCGTGCKNPDFVAPGAHVVSLRDPGSGIDQTYGSTGTVTDSLFRGSGTSQAAAVVSGAAALIISRTPTITPDQVKKLLASTAARLGGFDAKAEGAGEIRLANAYGAKVPSYVQKFTSSSGTGSLDPTRGLSYLMMNGVTLSGSQDIFGTPFDSASMAALEASAKSWSGGDWNAKSWSGADWSAKSWAGSAWAGNAWSAKSWAGVDWSSVSWASNSWVANGWSGGDWSANNWLSGSWANDVWADASWS